MKRTLALGLLGAALAAASLPALAQPAPEAPRAALGSQAPGAPPPAAGRPDAPHAGRHRGPSPLQAWLFQQADANRDSRLTEAEAMDYLAARFAEADASKDGGVTLEELRAYLRAQMEANRPAGRERRTPPPAMRGAMDQRMAMFFRMADANRDGRVTMDELRPVAASLLRAADTNGDGVLEMSELRHGGPRRGERDGPRRPPAPPAPPAPEAPPSRG